MSGPAAVHDDRVHADVLEQHDVARELLAQLAGRPSPRRRT